MASTNITYNCGCGFRTKKLEAACDHADEKGHVITVQGNIYTDVIPLPIKHRKTSTKNTETKKTVKPSPAVVEIAAPDPDFSSMKDRLRRPAKSP